MPSAWVKRNGVKKGDELEVIEENKILIVQIEKSGQNYSLTEDISLLNPNLSKIFLAKAYQKGYEKISLTHYDVNILKKIQETIPELAGYEIIEQNDKTCLIQSLSSNPEIDFDSALRKAFFIIQQMIGTCHKAYKDSDYSTLKNLFLKNIEVNRLCYFCIRQINRLEYLDLQKSQQSHSVYHLVEMLEEIAQTTAKLSVLLSMDASKNKNLVLLLNLSFEFFELVHSSFYSSSTDNSNRTYILFTEIEKNILSILQTKLTPTEIMCVFHINHSSSITFRYAAIRFDFNASSSFFANGPEIIGSSRNESGSATIKT